MKPHDFIAKWRGVEQKERSASQSHFNDLCALLDVPDPISADPKGEWFAFEKGASKTAGGEGWADVWRRECFAWEYKGLHEGPPIAAYRPASASTSKTFDNPPLLVVSATWRSLPKSIPTSPAPSKKVYAFALDRPGGRRNQTTWLSVRAFLEPDPHAPQAGADPSRLLTEDSRRCEVRRARPAGLHARGVTIAQTRRRTSWSSSSSASSPRTSRLLPKGTSSGGPARPHCQSQQLGALREPCIEGLLGRDARRAAGLASGRWPSTCFNGGLFADVDTSQPLRPRRSVSRRWLEAAEARLVGSVEPARFSVPSSSVRPRPGQTRPSSAPTTPGGDDIDAGGRPRSSSPRSAGRMGRDADPGRGFDTLKAAWSAGGRRTAATGPRA